MKGQITKVNKEIYWIDFNEDKTYHLRGIFRINNEFPVTGDYVEYNPITQIIENVFEHKNQLTRPRVANIDQAVIVVSITEPKFNSYLLHKVIMHVESCDIPSILVFTKTDIAQLSYLNIFKDQGYQVIEISNKTQDNIAQLSQLLENKLSVFMGQSGVGKSSTVNSIFKTNLKVQEISKALKSGKHTTRVVEIFKQGNISIIDTPGFSTFQPELDINSVSKAFTDFRKYANECEFRDCLHWHEKHCKVKEALKEKLIWEVRYNDYIRFVKELKNE